MTNTHTLALTDDEAAAIALRAEGGWRTPLPTVDQASEADLAAAVLRGRRSLAVRDLVQRDGTPTGPAAEVLARLGTGPRAAFTLVDEKGHWIPSGLTVYLYGTSPDDVVMSHVVAGAGVHYFRVEPPAGQWTALTELAEAVFDRGFTEAKAGAAQPAAAVLSLAGRDGIRNVLVPTARRAPSAGPVRRRSRPRLWPSPGCKRSGGRSCGRMARRCI